jgi:dephospho-CoA kinase
LIRSIKAPAIRKGTRPTRRTRPNRNLSNKPLAVAITGGIGAGKSEALKAFARHGAATISSDEIVHELLSEDEEVKTALRERFGGRVFTNGDVDRSKLGELVFGDRDQLLWLEGLLHPRTSLRSEAWLEELRRRPNAPDLAVNEVPLLYEAGAEKRFDAVVVITAPREVRERRAGERLDEREERLMPDAEKARRADFAYVNDGSLDQLDRFVREVIGVLEKRA